MDDDNEFSTFWKGGGSSEMSDQFWNWLIVAGGATAGVMMKMGQWRLADGGVDWWRVIGECTSIPGITYIVVGGVTYWDPNLDIRAVAALAALLAVAGTAGIEAAFTRWVHKKIDGAP